MPADENPPSILLLSDDLLFPSRIREALRPLPYTLRTAGTESALRAAIAVVPPAAILVNLNARRLDPLAAIRVLKADSVTASIPLLAFAGHLETEKHHEARAAGADLTAANSSVSLHLPTLLARLLGSPLPESTVDTTADGDAASEIL